MANRRDPHIVTRAGWFELQRPATDRPAGRQRPQGRLIDEIVFDLAGARQQYEQLRGTNGPLVERARLVSLLHELRAEASQARRSLGRA